MRQDSKYIPQPADLTDVTLDRGLEDLIEVMAENVHEVWAQARIDEGWTYGLERSDERKEHPCLVSYADLPEAERQYDRNTAIGTLKLIHKLGYRIIRDEE